MRLLLKTKTGIVNAYWVTSGNKSVKGWHSGIFFQRQLNVYHLRADFHFTYPESGEYHFSYKSMNSDPEFYITVFWNNVKIKTIKNGVATIEEISKEEFDKLDALFLGHLMPAYQPFPIKKVTGFQFPAIGLNIFKGDLKKEGMMETVPESKVTQKDLVVDVAELDKYNISIYGIITDTEELEYLSNLTKDDTVKFKTEKVAENCFLHLVAIISFNDKL